MFGSFIKVEETASKGKSPNFTSSTHNESKEEQISDKELDAKMWSSSEESKSESDHRETQSKLFTINKDLAGLISSLMMKLKRRQELIDANKYIK